MGKLMVEVEGFTFGQVVDGVGTSISDFDGWDAPDVEVERVDRAVDHGQFDQPVRRGGRTPTITGLIGAPEHAAMEQTISQVSSLLAGGELGTMTVTHESLPVMSASVRLGNVPRFDRVSSRLARYQIQFWMASPYRSGSTSTGTTQFGEEPTGVGMEYDLSGDAIEYGAEPGPAGICTVSNAGSVAASPTFSIAGPGPVGGFRIVEVGTGNELTYLGDLPSGSTLVIAPGSVLIDGVTDRASDLVVTGSFPSVPAGGSRDFQFMPIADFSAAVLTVTVTALYW